MSTATLYQQTAITTVNRQQIVVLLYEGAIRSLKQARTCILQRDYPGKNHLFTKARKIILELNVALDMDAGGDVAKNLRSIYTFLWTRLSKVNIRNDVDLLDKLILILEDLLVAWKRILTN